MGLLSLGVQQSHDHAPAARPYGIGTSFRDRPGSNVRLRQVLDFDPASG